MIARLPLRGSKPHPALQQLIDRHGARAVLVALIGMMISRPAQPKRRRRRATATDHLNAHLRRDIGLPPHRLDQRRHWDIRL